MVDFHDRRDSIGSGDFNNPKGTFEVVTHGYNQQDRWSGMSPEQARAEIQKYYKGQKGTKTWAEANRLARKRTDHQARSRGFSNGNDYADAYQEHLVRVMATKGPVLADQFGELQHRQSGYGRT